MSINLLIENLVLSQRSFRRVKIYTRDARERRTVYRASSEFLRFARCSLIQIEDNCGPFGLFFRELRMSVMSSWSSEAAFTKNIGAQSSKMVSVPTLMGKVCFPVVFVL